jgi:hypothetical protein
MREALLGRLLPLLVQAPTEELARLLADLRRRLGARGLQEAPAEPAEPGPAERGLAAKVFELLTALDPDQRLRKAPPIKVFLLHFRQNLSRSQIARLCDCHKSLVALRLKAIKEKLSWEPRQLRELSAQVEAMDEALRDSRARRIYRKGAVHGDEEEDAEC